MITHYPQTGSEMDASNGVSWQVFEYQCPECGAGMVEVCPTIEPPEYPPCGACRFRLGLLLANHLASEHVAPEAESGQEAPEGEQADS